MDCIIYFLHIKLLFFCLIFLYEWVERLYFTLWSMGSFPSQRKLNETAKKTPAGPFSTLGNIGTAEKHY